MTGCYRVPPKHLPEVLPPGRAHLQVKVCVMTQIRLDICSSLNARRYKSRYKSKYLYGYGTCTCMVLCKSTIAGESSGKEMHEQIYTCKITRNTLPEST